MKSDRLLDREKRVRSLILIFYSVKIRENIRTTLPIFLGRNLQLYK